ncbi:MAG: outer membrane protein assembly factor BamD [Rhodospirillaceae bacterium]
MPRSLTFPAFRISLLSALLVLPLLVFGLSACSSTKEELPYVERPPEQIYGEAAKAMEDKEYKKAAKLFDEVERQHPYSQWATRAQLMAAFAHYENLKYDDAILALDRYIQLHPGSEQAAYAYYLRSLCFYEQITDVGRDQKITRQALDALREVVRRFPNSEYARDAKLKIDLTNDHLAGKEMEIGRFYLKQRNYMAAIGRFRKVVDDFQTTSHTAESLHRLVECYLSVGLPGEAQRAAAVLGHNFPGSDWYEDSYALLTGAGIKTERAKYQPGTGNAPAEPVDDGSGQRSLLGRIWNTLF